jgi:hypothetical protein
MDSVSVLGGEDKEILPPLSPYVWYSEVLDRSVRKVSYVEQTDNKFVTFRPPAGWLRAHLWNFVVLYKNLE